MIVQGYFGKVRISKSGNMFCYPEHIAREMDELFNNLSGLKPKFSDRRIFITEATRFLSALNAIHPFREGNGRTQLSFLIMLAAHFGYAASMEQLQPEQFLEAMIESFRGNESLLEAQLDLLF